MRIFDNQGKWLHMKKEQLPKNGFLYLEAFPFHSSIIDSCDLEVEEREFARLLAGQLLKGALEMTFQCHSRSEEKLHHLHFESRNWERIGGQRCLAFGFPLFLMREPSSVKLAPVFLWPATLEPDLHRPNFWTLRSAAGKGPVVNPLLASLLPEGNSLPEPSWSAAEIPDTKALQQYGQAIAGQLGADWQENWEAPYPVPPLEVIGDLSEQKALLPCMVLGAFKPAFLQEADEDAWLFEAEPLPPSENRQPFERSRFSPFQAAAWEKAQHSKTTLVEQSNQQATADWVTDLLFNALANGERALIVSDRLSRLSQLQSRLSSLSADWLTFLLKDPAQDSYLLSELMKARLNNEDTGPVFPQDDFKVTLAKAVRHKEKLDKAYQSLQKELLGPNNWTELTGLYLKSSAIEGKELLSSQLSTQDFQFSFEEYEAFKDSISRSIPLYNRINTLKHPLTSLHASHFLEKSKEEALKNLEKLIQLHTGRLEGLNHEILRQTDAYALKLNDHLEQGFLSLQARLNQLVESFTDHRNKYGDSFERSGNQATKLKGLFNARAKQLAAAKEEITQSYLALARRHQEHNFFDFHFLSAGEAKNMSRVNDSIKRYGQALNDWRSRIRERVLEEVARLNQQTVFPDIGFQEPIAHLEERIDHTLSELNEAKIYGEQMEANMLTLPKKQKYLDSILEKLETTSLNLRDFAPFYDWQRHWLMLTEPQQRVMRALIKVKPQNWTSAFESWYLHHCLNRHYTDDLPTDDQALKNFHEAWTGLQSYLPPLVQRQWLDRQHKAFKSWKRNNKLGFQAWLGKGKHTGAPKSWFDGNWEALHDLFPVWMMPDGLAASMYDPDNCPEIDWAIVWEHEEIEPSIWKAIAPKVKRWVVIGDQQGKLFQKLREKGWPSLPLLPLPPSVVGDVLEGGVDEFSQNTVNQTIAVGGLYDFSKHTNEAEAQEAVRLLNDIRPTPARTFPSVAILTFTAEQRDLIARYLLQIKQRNQQGSEKIRSLERNGLTVLQADEFLGASFDHIILSTTIGPVDVQGTLPPDTTFFSSPAFERAVRALEQSASQQKYLLHSFSEAHLSAPRMSPFLRLENPAEHSARKPVEEGLVPEFNREVQALLQTYFDDWRFYLHTSLPDIQIPLLLRRDGFQNALIPDLFLGNAPATSYTWEWEAREALRERGYHLQPVWSALFWKNPRQEARKLASRIISGYNKLLKDEAKREEETESHPEQAP